MAKQVGPPSNINFLAVLFLSPRQVLQIPVWPIPALIRIILAPLCRPDSGAESAPDPDPAVWRFWHGGGDVVALPECGGGVEVFSRASARGVGGDCTHP